MRNQEPGGNGLISLTAGMSDLGLVETWRPRRIGIAGVRFNTGGDDAAKAAADKAAADAAAADKGKTPEQIAADKKTADDAAAAKAAADAAAAKDGKGGKDGDDSQPKAPDKYELTLSDEAKTAVGDAVTGIQADVEADAKANGWTNAEAQQELDFRLSRANERLTALRDKWLTDLKADPDYGGEKLETSQQLARKAVEALRPAGHARRDSFLSLLNGSGIGNHPEVVSFLADLGKLMGEDAPNLGKNFGKEPEVKKDAEVLFPSSAAKT